MRRHLLNLATALSLLLCAVVVGLWVATNEMEARFGTRVPGLGRYTLHSQYGEVRVFGLRPPSPASRRLGPVARRIRNEDLFWELHYDERVSASPVTVSAGLGRDTACFRLVEQARRRREVLDDMVHPLVEALEDPNRFAAAHVVLSDRALNGWRVRAERVGRVVRAEYQGLPLELDVSRSEKTTVGTRQFTLSHDARAVKIDPASRIAIRDFWHAQLDVPLGSVPYGTIVALTSLLPAVRAASALGRRMNSRRGLCTGCGYDLRATPGGCPECGAGR